MTDVTPKISDAVESLRGKDQADGLRKIFGDGGAIPTFVIVSSLQADASVTAGIGVAHLMLREGKRLLFVDQVPLGDRFDQRHFNKVRYDVSQALTGTVPLEKVASRVSERFWFSAGAKLQGLLRRRLTRQPITVPQSVARSSLEVDLILTVTQKNRSGCDALVRRRAALHAFNQHGARVDEKNTHQRARTLGHVHWRTDPHSGGGRGE